MIASTDIIRDKGLEVLRHNAQGVRLSELFELTKEALEEEGYEIKGENIIRNSLWDIADRFPKHVDKVSAGKRKVLLFPKLGDIDSNDSDDCDGVTAADMALTDMIYVKLNMESLFKSNEVSNLKRSFEHVELDSLHLLTTTDMEIYFETKDLIERLERLYKKATSYGKY